jgi:membrane protein
LQSSGFGFEQVKSLESGKTSKLTEAGRGRQAIAPWQVPWKGWQDILLRTYEQSNEDRLLAVAGGVVFYGLLALFPAITAMVSFYGLFAKPSTINDHLAIAADFLPAGVFGIVKDQIARVVAKGDAKLSFAFVSSFLLATWSANGGMKAVLHALNVFYQEKERRGFICLNIVSLAFTFSGLIAVLVAIGSVVALPIVLSTIGLGGASEVVLRVGRWPALVAMTLLGLATLYRFGPSRRKPRWRWISVGSFVATVVWIAGSALLSFYLTSFADYDAMYGSLGAVIGTMSWMWMSTIVILFGAELNSEIEHQTAKDSTDGNDKPMGARGANVADTVGKVMVS